MAITWVRFSTNVQLGVRTWNFTNFWNEFRDIVSWKIHGLSFLAILISTTFTKGVSFYRWSKYNFNFTRSVRYRNTYSSCESSIFQSNANIYLSFCMYKADIWKLMCAKTWNHLILISASMLVQSWVKSRQKYRKGQRLNMLEWDLNVARLKVMDGHIIIPQKIGEKNVGGRLQGSNILVRNVRY